MELTSMICTLFVSGSQQQQGFQPINVCKNIVHSPDRDSGMFDESTIQICLQLQTSSTSPCTLVFLSEM